MGVPTTVSFIDTGAGDAYVEVGAWVAVIVVVPGLKSVAIAPLNATTVGSDAVKLHVPEDVDVGGCIFT